MLSPVQPMPPSLAPSWPPDDSVALPLLSKVLEIPRLKLPRPQTSSSFAPPTGQSVPAGIVWSLSADGSATRGPWLQTLSASPVAMHEIPNPSLPHTQVDTDRRSIPVLSVWPYRRVCSRHCHKERNCHLPLPQANHSEPGSHPPPVDLAAHAPLYLFPDDAPLQGKRFAQSPQTGPALGQTHVVIRQ